MNKEGFCPGQFHLHRFLRYIGEKRCQMLHCHIFLTAKTAAYQCILNFYFVSSKKQRAFMECLMCRLICRINKNISIFIIESHCTFRLQKRMLRPGCLKML